MDGQFQVEISLKKLQDFINELESKTLGHAMYTDTIIKLLQPILEDSKKVYQIEFEDYDKHVNHGIFYDKKSADLECAKLNEECKDYWITLFTEKQNPNPKEEYNNHIKEHGTYYKVIEYQVIR